MEPPPKVSLEWSQLGTYAALSLGLRQRSGVTRASLWGLAPLASPLNQVSAPLLVLFPIARSECRLPGRKKTGKPFTVRETPDRRAPSTRGAKAPSTHGAMRTGGLAGTKNDLVPRQWGGQVRFHFRMAILANSLRRRSGPPGAKKSRPATVEGCPRKTTAALETGFDKRSNSNIRHALTSMTG